MVMDIQNGGGAAITCCIAFILELRTHLQSVQDEMAGARRQSSSQFQSERIRQTRGSWPFDLSATMCCITFILEL